MDHEHHAVSLPPDVFTTHLICEPAEIAKTSICTTRYFHFDSCRLAIDFQLALRSCF